NSVAQLFPGIVQNYLSSPILGFVGILESSVQTLKKWFVDITNATDAMNDMATASGVNVQQLSAFGLAAENAGGNAQSLAEGMKFLEKNTADALSGNKDTIAGFERLGITMDDLRSHADHPLDLMLQLGDAIRDLPDAAHRTA